MPACTRRTLLAVLLTAGLGACAGLGNPRTVTLGPAEIERLLQRQFPLERRLLELFDVTLAAPKLRLLPERDRIGAVVDVAARDRLLRGVWRGQLDFDAALHWEPREQAVRLVQVRVHDLALDDPAAATRSTAERLGAAAAERVIEGIVIYRLPPQQAQQLADRGLRPSGIRVTPRGIEIGLTALEKTSTTPTEIPSNRP